MHVNISTTFTCLFPGNCCNCLLPVSNRTLHFFIKTAHSLFHSLNNNQIHMNKPRNNPVPVMPTSLNHPIFSQPTSNATIQNEKLPPNPAIQAIPHTPTIISQTKITSTNEQRLPESIFPQSKPKKTVFPNESIHPIPSTKFIPSFQLPRFQQARMNLQLFSIQITKY